MSGKQRFRIKRSSWVQPLLVLFGVTDSRAWVELGESELRTRYGWHRLTVPYSAVRAARRSEWPWYAGIGWRTNFRSLLGLIGSYDGIVELVLEPEQRTRLLGIPFGVQQLFISLEHPDRFLEEIHTRAGL